MHLNVTQNRMSISRYESLLNQYFHLIIAISFRILIFFENQKNAKINAVFHVFLNFFVYNIDVDIKSVNFDNDIDDLVVLKQQSVLQFSSETLILTYHFIISS